MLPLGTISPIAPARLAPDASPETKPPSEPRQTQPLAEPEAQQPSPAAMEVFRDVAVRYKIDPVTHTLTLMLIDKKSREVIRTVPPEELGRLGIDRIFENLA